MISASWRPICRINELQASNRQLVKGIDLGNTKTRTETQKSSKLAHIIFKEYRYRVLQLLLLNDDESYHVREIARITETVPGTLHKELRALSEAGLLIRKRSGNQIVYAANLECPIYAELRSILTKI